ncbi:MAG TPA: amino acid adenylation domain-containing protein [Polyangiales bacterium]
MSHRIALSDAQEGIRIGQALAPESAAYGTAECVELRGTVDVTLLAASARQALHEAEGLRARVLVDAEGAYQELDAELTLEPQLLSVADSAAAFAWMEADADDRFDLARGPLARQALFSTADGRVFWYVAAHHLALDGYAFSLLIQRAAELYTAASEGRPAAPCPFTRLLPTVEEQRAYTGSPDYQRDRAFWRQRMEGAPEPRPLVDAPPRVAALPRRLSTSLDARTLAALEPASAGRRPGWLHAITGLFAEFVGERTGERELVLGLPVLARVGSLALRCPTMLMNIAPLRLEREGQRSLRAAAEHAFERINALMPHSRYRYEQLRRDLGRVGGARRLFGPVLNLMPFPRSPRFGQLVSAVHTVSAGPVDELSLNVHPLPGRAGLSLRFEAHPDSFSAAALAELSADFVKLVRQRAAEPERAFTAGQAALPDLVLDGEALAAPAHDVLTSILERARSSGADVAIQDRARTTSYAELAGHANALAERLRRHGVGRGSLVALHLARSREAIAAMLATLLCGAAYVPLDPEGPDERAAAIVRAAKPALLLFQAELPPALRETGVATCHIGALADGGLPDTFGSVDPAAPAYVIFTSGSTGEPNGVVIGRAALAHFVAAARQRYGVSQHDRVLQFASLAFDASVEEIFVTLASGARLVLRTSDMLESSARFLQRCGELSITLLDLPTAFFHELAYAGSEAGLALPNSLRTLIIGGEAASAERVLRFQRWSAGRVRLLNTYGPTETTVVATCADLTATDCSSAEALPIGVPLPGVRAILRPPAHDPRSGVYQLWLLGPTLASGYLGRDELTRQRFEGAGPLRAYHTGDLVRRAPDGQLRFAGRRDDQLKISGHRVELREVEVALLRHPSVREVAVVVKAHNGHSQLVAHLVAAQHELDLRDLRAHARRHLIAAAVPARFLVHAALPLTTGGKLDRRRLSQLPLARTEETEEEALGALERTVLEIFREVLARDLVGLDDDFFELGGQSLQTIQVANRLSKQLACEVEGALLFQHPNVRALAQALATPARARAVVDVEATLLADARLGELAPSFRESSRATQGAVLLTGATGFLGVHLLRELLLRTQRSVVCLVRADSERHAHARLRDSFAAQRLDPVLLGSRVRAVAADLSKPRFSLTQREFERLGADTDLFVHNAASVSLTRAYASVRAINLESTRELLRLASRSPAPSFHFVSTLAVALGALPGQAAAERIVPYHATLGDGYSQSKWASEQLLAEASERGLRLKIYRLGRLVGALDSYAVNRDDLIVRLLAAGVRVGALPALPAREPWTPVDAVARAIVAGALEPEDHGAVYHLTPHEPLLLADVMHWTRDYGYPLAVVSPEQFRARLRAAADKVDPATLALLESLAERALPDVGPIETARAEALLARSNIDFPRLGAAELHRYLASCVAEGLMPAPGAAP